MNKYLALPVLSALAFSSLSAEDWSPVGAKGLAMSGAQVANPEGSQAILTNPAALGKKDMNRADLALPLTISLGSAGTLIEDADRLYKQFDDPAAGGVQASLDRLGDGTGTAAETQSDIKKVSDFLTKDAKVLDKPGQGIRFGANGALTARWGRVGIAVGGRAYAAGSVNYDSSLKFSSTGTTSFISSGTVADIKALPGATNPADAQLVANVAKVKTVMTTDDVADANDLNDAQLTAMVHAVGGSGADLGADQIQLVASLADETNRVATGVKSGSETAAVGTKTTLDNATGVDVRALYTKELAVSYGFSFMDDKLHIAPTLKMIQGETRQSYVRLVDDTDTDVGDELTEDRNAKETTTFGVDLGLLYQPHPKWSLGLVLKDLNSPSFDMANGEEIELKAAARAGASYEYSQKNGWRGLVALDADLIENESSIMKGHESQQVALGVAQELMGFLSLRGGVAKDLASEGEGLSYSAGLGVQVYRFYIDLAGAISSDEVTIDGEDYPVRGGVGLTIGWNQNF